LILCQGQFVRHKIFRHTMLVFTLMVVIFFSIWTKAFIGSMNNFAKGEDFFRHKEYFKAITFFDRSMHWYTPFNPYIERSAEYLWEISNRAEQINDDQLSLIAIETIRNSFYSSRSFYSPGTAWIEKCETKIHNITGMQKEATLQGNTYSKDYVDKQIKYNDPVIFWTLILEIGFLGWIASVLGFIFFCLRQDKKINNFVHSYWFWISLTGINYSLWVLGMINA
jgi:hypothetical protein